MRYAIFSDIHGNLQAWEQVLADIRALEADVVICLGDVVGYGPKPQEVLDGIRSVTEYFVLGNHDAAAAGLIDPSIFNDHAHSVVLWTRENLTGESLEFLQNVPLQLDSEDLQFVHAEISEPGRFGYIEDVADAETNFAACDHFVTFIGHTHHPLIFEQLPFGAVRQLPDSDQELDPKCRYIVNVGSAGEPRNPDDIRARYVIYDSDTRNIYFRRIDFDSEVYRRDLAATSLTHSPYFLQVLDHAEGVEAAANAQDMRVPAQALQGFNTARRQLIVPTTAREGAKPKPMPATAGSGGGRSVGKIFAVLSLVSVLLIVCGWWFFLRETPSVEIDPGLLAETSPKGSSTGGNETSPPVDPASMGPRERLYSTNEEVPLVPEKEKEKVTAVVPGGKGPGTKGKGKGKTGPGSRKGPAPKATPASAPVRVVATPPKARKPKVETVAHWAMNSESVITGLLQSREDGVSLKGVFPAKSFDNIAPNPVPQTASENPNSLARGAWIETGSSGIFDLSPDTSFTFEGWVLISPNQPPVFIGGTQYGGKEPGWRLDLKSADVPGGAGSVRFFYSNGTKAVSAQTNDILLNKPIPHHFAVVWSHQAVSAKVGRLLVYFDEKLVAETDLAHGQIATTKTDSLFRLSSPDNPEKIAMDEIRFSRGRIMPDEFLSSLPIPEPGEVAGSIKDVNFKVLDGPADLKGGAPLAGIKPDNFSYDFGKDSLDFGSHQIKHSGTDAEDISIKAMSISARGGGGIDFSSSLSSRPDVSITAYRWLSVTSVDTSAPGSNQAGNIVLTAGGNVVLERVNSSAGRNGGDITITSKHRGISVKGNVDTHAGQLDFASGVITLNAKGNIQVGGALIGYGGNNASGGIDIDAVEGHVDIGTSVRTDVSKGRKSGAHLAIDAQQFINIGGNVRTSGSAAINSKAGNVDLNSTGGDVTIAGFVDARGGSNAGISIPNGGIVTISGTSIEIGGVNKAGISITSRSQEAGGKEGAGADIALTATGGDVIVAGGFDASPAGTKSPAGDLTISATGRIVLGSLDFSLVDEVVLVSSESVTISGAIKGLSPKGRTVSGFKVITSHVYYDTASNPGLKGDYNIEGTEYKLIRK